MICLMIFRLHLGTLEIHDVLLWFLRWNPRNISCFEGCILEGFWLFSFLAKILSEFTHIVLSNLVIHRNFTHNTFWWISPKLTKSCKQMQKAHWHMVVYSCIFNVRRFLLKAVVWFVPFFFLNSSEETLNSPMVNAHVQNFDHEIWRRSLWSYETIPQFAS